MKILIFSLLMIGTAGIARAQTAPQTYTNSSGKTQSVTMASATANNAVTVPVYKNSSGNWQSTLPISMICSVDANGNPQLCPTGMSQAAADARYIQQVSGSFSGTLTGASGSSIVMPGGYLQALTLISLSPDTNSSTSTTTDNSGSYHITPSNANGGVVIKAYTYATLPSSPVDQELVYCSDCQYNGYTGIILRWSSAQNWWMTPENTVYNASGLSSYISTNAPPSVKQYVQENVVFQSPPQALQFVITGGPAYMFLQNTNTYTSFVGSSKIASFNIGYVTWAQLSQYAPTGTAGDVWICSNCTLTYNNATVTGVRLFWNPNYGSNGGWDYDTRVMGAAFSHP